MFSFQWTKQHSQLIFTIHTVTLSEHYDEPFRIEWQRGDKSGETSLLYPGSDNIILFERRYTCDATVYISKKDGTIRKKLITFRVWRFYPDQSQKLFGKLTLDVSKFYGIATPVAGTYTLESPHRNKSTITITVRLSMPGSPLAVAGQSLTDGSMTSISETMSIVTDKTSVWDVSEVVSESDRKILEEFMDTQHRQNPVAAESGSSLAQFERPQNVRVIKGRSRRQTVKDDPKPIGLASLVDNRSTEKLSLFLKNRTNDVYASKDVLKADESTKAALTQPASRNLMRAVLTHSWQKTPVLNKPFPKISAILFALIEATQVFENSPFTDKGFSTFTSKFIELFEAGGLVENYTKLDMFVIAADFLALLPHLEEAIPERRETFIQKMSETGTKFLLEAAQEQAQVLSSVFVTLTYNPSLFETIITSFEQDAKQIKEKAQPFSSIIYNYAIKQFDRGLTLKIISLPGICSFGNAVSWNSFSSIISSELGIELKYLKQLAQCLIMSSSICEAPEKCLEICPDLPQSAVYELIKNQRSDEYMPILNDSTKFKEKYEKEIQENIDIHIKVDFSDITKSINTIGWENQDITEVELNEFPFLKTRFEHKE